MVNQMVLHLPSLLLLPVECVSTLVRNGTIFEVLYNVLHGCDLVLGYSRPLEEVMEEDVSSEANHR
jgi:hypothetical protein